MIAGPYLHLFMAMEKTANKLGYMLAVHGSLNRDLDLIAVPWTNEAATRHELYKKIAEEHNLLFSERQLESIRPHGRYTVTFHFPHYMGEFGNCYIDFSVMGLGGEMTKPIAPEVFDKVIEDSIELRGENYHLQKLAEECTEVSTEVLHHFTESGPIDSIAVEIADLEIAISAFRRMYGSERIEYAKRFKLQKISNKNEELKCAKERDDA